VYWYCPRVYKAQADAARGGRRDATVDEIQLDAVDLPLIVLDDILPEPSLSCAGNSRSEEAGYEHEKLWQ
jgi:hypothetical protein